jgi:hypothetical protein
VKSTSAALAAVLGAHAALATPPAGLAAAVTGAVVSSGLPAAAWSLVSFMSTKTTATVAAVVLVVAGGVATQQVHASREAIAGLAAIEQENAALAARLRAAEAARTTRITAGTQTPTPRPATAPATTKAELARRLGSGGFATVEESRAFLQANPEVRDALASYLHDSTAEQYAELFSELGLSESERERFLAILVSGMRQIVGEYQFSIGDDMTSGAEITRQLRELLGEERYQQYRTFRDNGAPRDVATEMTRSLYFTPTPFTPAQATELKRIVTEVTADPTLGAKYSGGWPYIPEPMWEKIVSDAKEVLSEPQVEALRELQQQSRFFHIQSAASREWHAKQKEKAK